MQSPDEYQPHDQSVLTFKFQSAPAQLSSEEARAAFLDFHQQEFVRVVAFVRKAGACLEDAEDAAQEAFIKAWRQINSTARWESIDEPRGWIRTVAMHEFFRSQKSMSQRTRRASELTEIIPRDPAPDPSELTVTAEFVCAILRELDPDCRAVMAFHIDGFKSNEIARHLGMTDQRVRDLKKKGRKVLKEGLAVLRETHGRTLQ